MQTGIFNVIISVCKSSEILALVTCSKILVPKSFTSGNLSFIKTLPVLKATILLVPRAHSVTMALN